jgi:hypothetical protein
LRKSCEDDDLGLDPVIVFDTRAIWG